MLNSARVDSAIAPALELSDITLDYPARGGSVRVLEVPALNVAAGAIIAVTGPSGSGKTSLVNLLAGIELPTSGSVTWGGRAISREPETLRDRWRRETVGLVFQDFHLIPNLTALQNVLLPLRFDHFSTPPEHTRRALDRLRALGLRDAEARAGNLSRGEQQRVAVARALLRGPRIILADEPTASLDAANGVEITELLLRSAQELGATMIVVSHDPALLARVPAVIRLQAGRVATQEGRAA